VSPTSRVWGGATAEIQCREFNSDAHCCHMMGKAVKHPVPDRVKPSFVIFDIRTLWRSVLSVRVPGCQNYSDDSIPSGTGCFIAVAICVAYATDEGNAYSLKTAEKGSYTCFYHLYLVFFVWRRACHISLKPVVALTDDGMTVINADVFRTNHFSHVASKSRGVHG